MAEIYEFEYGGLSMSFDELVQRYRTRIAASSNKKQELEKILREIDKLKYSKSGRAISREGKKTHTGIFTHRTRTGVAYSFCSR